jgi:apolipoprotein N-acyltransferase
VGPGRRSRWGARGLALAAGAVPAFAFPEADLWWLGLVGLVPAVLVVRAAPTGGEAAVRAWIAGAAFMLGAHWWLLSYVSVFALVLGALFGALWVPWGWLAWRLLGGTPDGWRVVIAVVLVPSAWVAAEYVRSWDRLGGPFGLLGASQWNDRALLALAALGGVWLVSWVLVAINVALAAAVLPRAPGPGRVAAVGAAAGLVAASLLWAGLRTPPAVAGAVRVGIVQSGLGDDHAARLTAAIAATRELASQRPDVVVWGESTVTRDPATDRVLAARLERTARSVDAPVLINVDARGASGSIAKSAVLVTPAGVDGRYVKQRLVPFGEYVPLRPVLGWLADLTAAADEDRARGAGLVVLDAGGLRVGPLVSFELAFPDLSRALTRNGAELIAAQSMTSSFQRSWGPEQHASLAAVRAVESGRPVVDVAISGVSAAFAADGRELAWHGTDERGAWVVVVPRVDSETPYVRAGDWVVWTSLGVLGVAAAVWAGRRLARRRAQSP